MPFPTYPEGPFTKELCVGGSGGGEFSTCGWVTNQKALVVKKLQVWWNSTRIKAIQVTYADSSVSRLFGETTNSTNSITLAPGEEIISLVMWDNGLGEGGRGLSAGRIRLVTNQGQTFDAGIDTSGLIAYDAPTGSGILVGIVGRSGLDIDTLGAVFLNGRVASIAIDNVNYPSSIVGKTVGISPVSLSEVHFEGSGDRGTDWTFSNTVDRTTSSTFSQSSSTMFGISVGVTVSAEIFHIGAEVENTFKWETTKTTESSTTTSGTVSFSWGISGHLDDGKGVTCTAVAQMGLANVPYTSDITLTLADGTTSKYKEDGVYNNVVYSEASVIEEPDPEKKTQIPIVGP